MQEEQNPSSNGGSEPAGQPGQVIAPGVPAGTAVPQADSPTPAPQTPVQQPEAHIMDGPTYGMAPNAPEPAADDTITWTASEYIAHEKSVGWYAGLAGVALVIAVLVYLLTHDLVSSGVVVVSAVLLGIYGARQPRQLQYSISPDTITVGSKHFTYGEFRSFSILDDGAFSSIIFMPLKRFAPLLTIYYAPEDEERIVAMLSDRLPMDEHKLDAVDRLLRSIRF